MDIRRSLAQPRQSVFSAGGSVVPLNEGPASHLSYLNATLGEIAEEQKLEGTHDLERMMRIVENQRLFVLIDEPQLKTAQNQLEDEIGPQLNTLLERAEKAIEALDAKEQSLLSRISAVKSSQAAAAAKASAAATKRGDARRLQLLQTRRERAERELEEVEAETRKMASYATSFEIITHSSYLQEAEIMKG